MSPATPTISLSPVTLADLDNLVALRIAAMRPSLERLGRFDPQRARERLAHGFAPEHTRYIDCLGQHVGFVALKPQEPFWLLDHLYIAPEHQGLGLGSATLRLIIANANAANKALRVGALRGSDSHRFYQRHGFLLEREDEWDIYYVRPANPTANPDSAASAGKTSLV